MTDYFTPISYALWPSDKQAFAEALGKSFRETGFAVISDHPISPEIIRNGTNAAKAFFALPSDAKARYYEPGGGGQRGSGGRAAQGGGPSPTEPAKPMSQQRPVPPEELKAQLRKQVCVLLQRMMDDPASLMALYGESLFIPFRCTVAVCRRCRRLRIVFADALNL